MAAAKFSAFQFASEEFNSELARLVEGFTQSLVKIISEECARNGDSGEDSENGSKNSSPFSSPKGKAPRKKAAAAPKRGRPSKEETDVVIETVSDMRSVSDDLLSRAEVVRSSSASPRFSMEAQSKFDSIEVNLDEMLNQQPISSPENVVEEETPVKKGKAKVAKEPKVPKEKKEKVVKEKKEKVVKEPKAPKEKKEKVVKEPKVPKEKKEKVVKEAKPKKGKKGDVSPVTEETIKEPEPVTTILADEDDNDGLDAEIITSQEVDEEALEKVAGMVQGLKIGGDQLEEETDYVETNIVGKLEDVITSRQNSQEDEIVIEQDDTQESDKDDMSQPPPDDEDDDREGDDEDQEGDDEDQEGDGGDEL
jgi:segregation and condensation protein B